ncbi:cytospin-B isoform X1 [Pelobates cultripes]|uniref:Cytospin-B isoform X1 n=1 Tax=Pelobates cultripes TaxID=61616 RepID=A0AAD1QZM8_PELCU|nr:cytospin-B isoform X1 [Pelobates cultripes]
MPTTSSFGMKASRSTNSLAFESRLSKLKRASSDDMLTKPSGSIPTARLKKTITTGAISELSEPRLRGTAGVSSAARRTGIPAPRDLPTPISRERAALRPPSQTKKVLVSPSQPNAQIPSKNIRAPTRPKQENESTNKTVLESQVKELLAEAKTKDFEISKLRSELQKCKDKDSPSPEVLNALDSSAEIHPMQSSNSEAFIRTLQEKNIKFQHELSLLRKENEELKQKLFSLEHSPISDTITSNGTDSSLLSPSTSGASIGSKLKSPRAGESEDWRFTGSDVLHISGSSSSDVTKASLSPDASDFEHIVDVPSRPASSGSIPCQGSKCSTSGSSPNNISDLSVASLTERIHKMEENHHSTAEELQATLQELSDQNVIVQELAVESEKLVEEKAFLESSLQQQKQRVEQLCQENEKLMGILQERTKKEETEVHNKLSEVEKKYAELVENSQFEREKLLNIQQQLTSSLRSLEKEHNETQVMIKRLREDTDKLQSLLDTEKKDKSITAKALEEQNVVIEGLKIENSCLKSQLDGERQMVVEITAMGNNTGSSEVQDMLKSAHSEKEHLELTCSELRQELLRANSEVKQLQCLLAKVETECHELKQLGDQREEDLKLANLKLTEKEGEIKDMKDTIYELEDQVEQHRAVNLHNNQMISDLENKVSKLEEQKQDMERQQKLLTKQMKDDAEEWKRFQADLQTAVVVANDIKCEAQQELRSVRRRLQDEEEKSSRLNRELEEMQGSRQSLCKEGTDDVDSGTQWQSIDHQQAPTSSTEPPAKVKSLIKSFDVGQGVGQNMPVHSVARSPLSGIPVRTAPAAAVSPIQRLSVSSHTKLQGKDTERQLDFPVKLKDHGEDFTPERYPVKSPSLESLNTHSPISFGSRNTSLSLDTWVPHSKISVERKDPLAALAREYGGSKRNALLKWCQKKTEGYTNIDITNFSSSWSDGLAFCALLHTYLPAHIPYHELNSQDKKRNLMLAFQAAESIGIKPSLELNELMFTDRPDWQSVMQYVAHIYKYFET